VLVDGKTGSISPSCIQVMLIKQRTHEESRFKLALKMNIISEVNTVAHSKVKPIYEIILE
jgi:hypothetical protein